MKSQCSTFLTLLGAFLLIGSTVFGDAVVYDGFDYPYDDSVPVGNNNIAGSDGGIGFAGPWTNTRNSPDIVAPGLQYGSLVTIGNKLQGNAWSGVARPLGSTLFDAGLMDNGATLWLSAIMDLTDQNFTNADLNIALTNASKFHSSNFGDRQNLEGTASEGIGFTHAGGNIQGAWWQDNDAVADTVAERTTSSSSLTMGGNNPLAQLVVAKIEWGATDTADETLTLYGPNNSLEPGSPILSSWAIDPLDQSTFDTLALQFKDTARWDEIRFGASYEDVAVLPDPLTLQVNRATGEMVIIGDDDLALSVTYYEIQSSSNSLDITGWNSFTDQDLDGNGPSTGTGNGWEEAGGSGKHSLAEAYLLGETTIAANNEISIGKSYDIAIDAQDLEFRFLNSEGQDFDGVVQYISILHGDYNGDNVVDVADYTVWRNNLGAAAGTLPNDADGGVIGLAQYETWKANFGLSLPAEGALSTAAVPEPSTLALICLIASLGCLASKTIKPTILL